MPTHPKSLPAEHLTSHLVNNMNFQNVRDNLIKRGFKVSSFDTGTDAVIYLKKEIKNTSVGIGGSMTVKELNLYQELSVDNQVWWHGNGVQLKEYGGDTIIKNAMTADVYISSVNGLSEDGQIINIDGRCNRIASTLYGHKRVYFVVGKNKIAPSFEDAMWRARNIAAPKNAQRLGKKTPCAVKGDKCYDCSSPDRICRGFLILELPPSGTEVEIVLINQDLGY